MHNPTTSPCPITIQPGQLVLGCTDCGFHLDICEAGPNKCPDCGKQPLTLWSSPKEERHDNGRLNAGMMTKREHIATFAMQALIARCYERLWTEDVVAQRSREFADAMLAELEKER